MSNSTSKKRKESPNSSSKDVKEGGDMDQPSWMTKKHVTSSQGSGEEVGDDHADQVPARTPLKVSLKRHGKREHEGIERPFRDSADAETNAEEAMQIGPPPQKQSYPPNTFSANFNGDRLSENTQPSLFLEEGLENPSKSATNVTSQASYQLHPTQSPKVPIVSLPSTTPSMTITTYLGGENAGAIGSGGVSSTARPGVHAPRERQPQQGGLYLSSGERGGVAFHANGTGSGVGSSGQASSLSVGSSLLASSSCNAFAATSTTTTSAATTTNNNMATNLRASLRSTNGGIGQKQVKKLIIKSALEAPKIPENYLDITWQSLQEAVNSIHHGTSVTHSLEELYSGVEGLCTHNFSTHVYDKLQALLHQHLETEKTQLQAKTAALDDRTFLKTLNAAWQGHCEQMMLIRSIFLSLDRKVAAEASAERKPIWEMGLALFRKLVVDDDSRGSGYGIVLKRLTRGLLEAIEADRNALAVERSLVKSLTRMLISLGMYTEHFEPLFLQETERYYTEESARLTQDSSLESYLIHIEQRLDFEEHTIALFLAPASTSLLLQKLYDVLITKPLTSFIIAKGFSDLLDADKFADLKRTFRIVSLIDAQKPLRLAWNQYIKKRGSELVNDRSKDKTMIEELLAFRARLDRILNECFASNPDFLYSLKEGFEGAINSRLNAPSEMLAKFVDRHLQSGSRTTSSDVEFEALFEKVMLIFRSLNSKDVFEAFYRKDLAKRLLLQRSASVDAEKLVLSKLKDECGAQYISKMEGMFKDIDLSKDLTSKFAESLIETPDPLIGAKTDIGIHVLTTSYWPTFVPAEINLPSELAAIHQNFSKFYLKQFHARNLVWLNSHGHVTLRAAFPKGRREISVSTFQACVLLLFNDVQQMTYADIASATGIKDADELKRTVLSLFCGQYKVLTKLGEKKESTAPATPSVPSSPTNQEDNTAQYEKKEIANTDIFAFNIEFTSKKVRIKINQIQLKETKIEQTRTQEAVFQDRIGQVDAALVRIMKTRKTLHHNELIAEVINILKFPFQPADLKKRIETLIDREFLARDKHDSTIYNYIP